MAKLVVQPPHGAVRDVKLDRDRITIGRRADNDVCLPYPAVSAEHAEIVTVMADSFLHDCGSTNGTFVNGQRISKHFLHDHDRIDIGRIQLVYLTNEAETVEPMSPERSSDSQQSLPEMSTEHERTTSQGSDVVGHRPAMPGVPAGPVDELLDDLMEMNGGSSTAVEIPPAVSVVHAPRTADTSADRLGPPRALPPGGAYVEVMNGPHTGQITRMTRRQFAFGKAGATVAVIRLDEQGYRLVPTQDNSARVNGKPVRAEGVSLGFGDTIEVGGVKLLFGHRGLV